jgi:predicted ABC-type ATPase
MCGFSSEDSGAKVNSNKRYYCRDLVLLAQKLSPHDVRRSAISAGKMFLRALDKLVLENRSFIIETTLSGKCLLHRIAEARHNGFIVRLVLGVFDANYRMDPEINSGIRPRFSFVIFILLIFDLYSKYGTFLE